MNKVTKIIIEATFFVFFSTILIIGTAWKQLNSRNQQLTSEDIMSLQFSTKDKMWFVMHVDANGRMTVRFYSVMKSQCVQYMEGMGYYQ